MIIKTTIRYTERFKAQVLKDLEDGSIDSYEGARRKYNIKGNCTIQKWIKKAGDKDHLLHKKEIIDIWSSLNPLKVTRHILRRQLIPC